MVINANIVFTEKVSAAKIFLKRKSSLFFIPVYIIPRFHCCYIHDRQNELEKERVVFLRQACNHQLSWCQMRHCLDLV